MTKKLIFELKSLCVSHVVKVVGHEIHTGMHGQHAVLPVHLSCITTKFDVCLGEEIGVKNHVTLAVVIVKDKSLLL